MMEYVSVINGTSSNIERSLKLLTIKMCIQFVTNIGSNPLGGYSGKSVSGGASEAKVFYAKNPVRLKLDPKKSNGPDHNP